MTPPLEIPLKARIVVALKRQDEAHLADEIDALAGDISRCFDSLPDDAREKCVRLAHSLAVVRGRMGNGLELGNNLVSEGDEFKAIARRGR